MVELEEFPAQEFQDRFDELFERVERGETFIIVTEKGDRVYITPISQTTTG